MADIFLSYAAEDLALARVFADVLRVRGWSVWWDHKIPPGMTYPEVIERELDACKCVIVVWSTHSVTSEWVKREVAEGDARKILAPVRVDDARIPFQFRLLHATDLRGWQGEPERSDLQEVFDRVSQLAPPKVPSATAPEPVHAVETPVAVAPRDVPPMELGGRAVRSKPERVPAAKETPKNGTPGGSIESTRFRSDMGYLPNELTLAKTGSKPIPGPSFSSGSGSDHSVDFGPGARLYLPPCRRRVD